MREAGELVVSMDKERARRELVRVREGGIAEPFDAESSMMS